MLRPGLKGATAGDAEISPVHANFIANRGSAKAADFLELIERARTSVRTATGIELETEVKITGRDGWEGEAVRLPIDAHVDRGMMDLLWAESEKAVGMEWKVERTSWSGRTT